MLQHGQVIFQGIDRNVADLISLAKCLQIQVQFIKPLIEPLSVAQISYIQPNLATFFQVNNGDSPGSVPEKFIWMIEPDHDHFMLSCNLL